MLQPISDYVLLSKSCRFPLRRNYWLAENSWGGGGGGGQRKVEVGREDGKGRRVITVVFTSLFVDDKKLINRTKAEDVKNLKVLKKSSFFISYVQMRAMEVFRFIILKFKQKMETIKLQPYHLLRLGLQQPADDTTARRG